jgi:protein-disulfide isomerase
MTSQAPTTRKERRAAERAARQKPVAVPVRPAAWRSPMVLITAAALLVGLVLIGLVAFRPASSLTPVHVPGYAAPAAELRDGRSLGVEDAPVTIDVYEDPQCPVCARWTKEMEPLLTANGGYIAAGTVRLTYHDYVFIGPESLDAAVAMRAAEQLGGRFWDYHTILYDNQSGENKGAFTRDRLAEMASLIGLDRGAFLALLDDQTLVAAVRAETAEGDRLGIDSTPTLVINGSVSSGIPSWADLSATIERLAAG